MSDTVIGSDLDAEVASRVFGGPGKHPEWYWWHTTNWAGWYEEGHGLPDGAEVGPFCGPKFSENITPAWTVAEAVRQSGREILVSSESDGWETEIVTTQALYEQGYKGAIVKAPTVSEAICRAAIKAFTLNR